MLDDIGNYFQKLKRKTKKSLIRLFKSVDIKIRRHVRRINQGQKKAKNVTDNIKDNIKITKTTKGNNSNKGTGSNSNKNPDNKAIKNEQLKLLFFAALIILVVATAISFLVVSKKQKQQVSSDKTDSQLKIEIAGKSLDPAKMWRNHFEQQLEQSRKSFDKQLESLKEDMMASQQELIKSHKEKLDKAQKQLRLAKEEMINSAAELSNVRDMQQELLAIKEKQEQNSIAKNNNFTISDQNNIYQFDVPKSQDLYVPETGYVSGYLLGGLAVSTAINAPDEQSMPVIIRLTDYGNLPKNIVPDIKHCRILGSAYGDLSSERAIIRLEKLICSDDGLITTTDIAGIVYGSDGMNGIKGQIVATSDKHIKNAFIGGLISGISGNNANSNNSDNDGLLAGLVGGKGGKKAPSFGKSLKQGMMSGTSSAADKIAQYYLRLAEQMSPILTVPGGVKVDAVFTKGFFIGEVGTRSRIRNERQRNRQVNIGGDNEDDEDRWNDDDRNE